MLNFSSDHFWVVVQAIGSVAAVWAAVAVGWATIRAENRRIAARGRVAAFRLAPYMVTIRGYRRRAQEACEALNGGPQAGPLRATTHLIESLSIPEKIPNDVFAESWALPPHVALSVSQLENLLAAYDRLLENVGGSLFAVEAAQRADFLRRISGVLDAIEKLASEINEYAAAVSDRVVHQTRKKDRATANLPQ